MSERGKIRIWNKCNNNCIFCSVDSKSNSDNENMTTEQIKKKIRDIKEEGCKEILIFGGEPTIRKDFFEIFDFIQKMDFERVNLQSNGRMFSYPDFINKAKKYNINYIISIHGHNKGLHNMLTNSTSFEQTSNGIKNLVKDGQKVSSNTVINKHNQEHIYDIAKMLIKEGVTTLQFALMHPFGLGKKNFGDLAIDINSIKDEITRVVDYCNEKNVLVFFEGFPLCMLGKNKDKATEKTLIKHIRSYSKEHEIESYRDWLREHKAKSKECERCMINDICEGYFKEYGEIELIKVEPE